MKKRKTPLWLGYLEAGKSASPVVRDSSLDTGNPATIYLFNLMRGRILEYRKDIVEITKFGVMLTPALVIDGDVKVVGRVASPDEIKEFLK